MLVDKLFHIIVSAITVFIIYIGLRIIPYCRNRWKCVDYPICCSAIISFVLCFIKEIIDAKYNIQWPWCNLLSSKYIHCQSGYFDLWDLLIDTNGITGAVLVLIIIHVSHHYYRIKKYGGIQIYNDGNTVASSTIQPEDTIRSNDDFSNYYVNDNISNNNNNNNDFVDIDIEKGGIITSTKVFENDYSNKNADGEEDEEEMIIVEVKQQQQQQFNNENNNNKKKKKVIADTTQQQQQKQQQQQQQVITTRTDDITMKLAVLLAQYTGAIPPTATESCSGSSSHTRNENNYDTNKDDDNNNTNNKDRRQGTEEDNNVIEKDHNDDNECPSILSSSSDDDDGTIESLMGVAEGLVGRGGCYCIPMNYNIMEVDDDTGDDDKVQQFLSSSSCQNQEQQQLPRFARLQF